MKEKNWYIFIFLCEVGNILMQHIFLFHDNSMQPWHCTYSKFRCWILSCFCHYFLIISSLILKNGLSVYSSQTAFQDWNIPLWAVFEEIFSSVLEFYLQQYLFTYCADSFMYEQEFVQPTDIGHIWSRTLNLMDLVRQKQNLMWENDKSNCGNA
jgi:hypothetical protein